ncbi:MULTISPECIES: ATP phosphoribosyltransferase [unclassified Candidatus Frackibacter]|jgi:ATP phosphoribosyltransferase|uniref:ATP phosphoribosyltransferase n=1 Tax=unclassified Candidatus Frackibacter TaxID=2648818 RepID=UPI00088734B3|nr:MULTISPECIES: ATP phosphoribosyltransferase [unclassified Candidatus Frackibacter]SDC51304.1 ATP phosphoribosyltransferase [Candidatus Frackibacter sp. WG11]SEM40816.1 ATP phosphoribosyltransferase [Candidatus Frackibacter sp. WG12]SFL75352.1 ATP phosphoribosyltransferase [Candidatus Frackibacter sp. WG13]
MVPLKIALPKGRLFDPVVNILRKAGVVKEELSDDSRKLILNSKDGKFKFILSKAVDVPTYVEYGAADIGVAGKDVLLEAGKNVCEVVDLGLGACRLVVAVPKERGITTLEELPAKGRVASKYPKTAEKFFNQHGIQVETIKLNGSIELAPAVDLAEMIVDITSTGTTLRENNLIEIAEIAKSSARLIVNKVSYKTRFNEVQEIIKGIERGLGERDD